MWNIFNFLKKKELNSFITSNSEINKIVKKQLLNKNQKELFATLNSVFNEPQNGQDRERVLAIFFLVESVINPNVPVFIATGGSNFANGRKNIVSLIKRILVNYPELEEKMVYYETSIMYMGGEKNAKLKS